MARVTNPNGQAVYRVLDEYTIYNGERRAMAHGPYSTLGAAKAARTREARETYMRADRVLTVQEAKLEWKDVEEVPSASA